jgi:hypothetical protein
MAQALSSPTTVVPIWAGATGVVDDVLGGVFCVRSGRAAGWRNRVPIADSVEAFIWARRVPFVDLGAESCGYRDCPRPEA